MEEIMVDIRNEDLQEIFGNADMVSVRDLINGLKDVLCEMDSQDEYYQDKIEDMKYENSWVYEYDPYDRKMDYIMMNKAEE